MAPKRKREEKTTSKVELPPYVPLPPASEYTPLTPDYFVRQFAYGFEGGGALTSSSPAYYSGQQAHDTRDRLRRINLYSKYYNGEGIDWMLNTVRAYDKLLSKASHDYQHGLTTLSEKDQQDNLNFYSSQRQKYLEDLQEVKAVSEDLRDGQVDDALVLWW